MKRTQRLIIILGEDSLINMVSKTIADFHAMTIIKSVTKEILDNVFYYNKNAVFFTSVYDMTWAKYNPIVIRLSKTADISNAVLSPDNVIEDLPKILDEYEVDAGDHATNDSSGMATHSTKNCLLCNILKKNTQNIEHILYETNSFYVVPGTSAFFPGYVMIIPKRHITSFGLLAPDEMEEFFIVLNDIRSILEGIYGKKIFVFECSSGKTGAGKHKTSIIHAHMHLAPTDMPVLKEVQASGLHPALIQKENLCQYGEYPYMLYIDQEDNWFITGDANAYFPRQHPRQVLANYMGCYDYYNWRIYPYRERMDVIAEEFRSFCSANFETLPKWVQKSICFED